MNEMDVDEPMRQEEVEENVSEFSPLYTKHMDPEQGEVWCMVFVKQTAGMRVYLGFAKGQIVSYDMIPGQSCLTTLANLTGHYMSVLSLCVSADQSLMVSSSIDGEVRFWALDQGEGSEPDNYGTMKLWKLTFAPNGEVVTGGSADGKILHITPPRLREGSNAHYEEVQAVRDSDVGMCTCLRYSEEGGYLSAGFNSGHVWVSNQNKKMEVGSMQLHKKQPVKDVLLAGEDSNICFIAALGDGTVILFQIDQSPSGGESMTRARSFHAHTGPVVSLSLSKPLFNPLRGDATTENAWLATGGCDHWVKVWDFGHAEPQKRYKQVAGWGSNNKNKIEWSLQTVRQFFGEVEAVRIQRYRKFCNDHKLEEGTCDPTNDDDLMAFLCKNKCAPPLIEYHTGQVNQVSFIENGRLVSIGNDGHMMLFQTPPYVSCKEDRESQEKLYKGFDEQGGKLWNADPGKKLSEDYFSARVQLRGALRKFDTRRRAEAQRESILRR